MSDWQKARITFNDADGNEVSVMMWVLPNYASTGYTNANRDDVGVYVSWARNDKRVTVTPIRELPTGVGAVIRRIGTLRKGYPSDDIYTLSVDGKWRNGYDAKTPDQTTHWEYEILSEGIQIGDVK